jgi:Fe-Mn family superoxide dismutase
MAKAYEAKDFSKLLGMPGFSDTLLNNHFKLYQGYVKNANLVNDKANALCASGQGNTPEFAELKRRLGWEFDGMRLHELYFGNLGGKEALGAGTPLAKAISGQFGNLDNFKTDFVNVGTMRGIGWVILYEDPETGRLFNCWINEHDTGHLAGCTPILVMDVFEHAYVTDYQLDRKAYIEAFWKNVDWTVAAARYQAVAVK